MNKKLIFIGISVGIITLIIIIGIFSSNGIVKKIKDDVTTVELELDIPHDFLRVYQEICLSVLKCPDDAEVSWDLGNGNTATGKVIYASYEKSDAYNISVEAKSKSFHGYGNGTVWIYNTDIERSDSGSYNVDLRPGSASIQSIECEMLPSLIGPLLEVDIRIDNGVGDIEISVILQDSNDPNLYSQEIDRQSFTGRRNMISYEEDFMNLPTPPEGHTYRLIVSLNFDQAVSGDWTMEFWVQY